MTVPRQKGIPRISVSGALRHSRKDATSSWNPFQLGVFGASMCLFEAPASLVHFPSLSLPFEAEPDAVVLPEAHILGWMLQEMNCWICKRSDSAFLLVVAINCYWRLTPKKFRLQLWGDFSCPKWDIPSVVLLRAAGFCWRRSRLRSNLSGAKMLWWALSLEMTS